MITMHLSNFYVVVTDFHRLGFGSAGDATTDRDEAIYQWKDCIRDNQPTRAFRLDFDVETGALESASEVTSDFMDLEE